MVSSRRLIHAAGIRFRAAAYHQDFAGTQRLRSLHYRHGHASPGESARAGVATHPYQRIHSCGADRAACEADVLHWLGSVHSGYRAIRRGRYVPAAVLCVIMGCEYKPVFGGSMAKRNPVVLITGASHGIGAAAATLAARDGFDVAIGY